MHSRREYSPHYTNEKTDPINQKRSSTIKNNDNTTLNFRSAIETQPRENSFSPESMDSPTYDYKSIPRSSDTEPQNPSSNVSRNMVTISRRDSPNHSSAFSCPQIWSHGSDVVYKTKNNHFTNNNPHSSNEQQFLREPVYKTTMITQVKSPNEHGSNDGFHKKALEQQHYAKQKADQHFIKFSAKQPQQPMQYKLQQYISEPENKQQTFFQNDSNKKPVFYSSHVPYQSNQTPSHSSFHPSNQPSFQPSFHPSNQPSFHPSNQPSFHPSNQLSPNSEKQYIISSYKPNKSEKTTFFQPTNPLRSSSHQPITRQLDDYSNNNYNYPSSNTNNNNNILLNNNNKDIYANTNNNMNNNNSYIYNNKLNSSNATNNSSLRNNDSYSSKYNSMKTVSRAEAEVDELTDLLVENMRLSAQPDFYGMCVKCSGSIMGSTNGCLILNQTYHLSCFLCASCSCSLTKGPFFNKDGVSFCEECYMKSLENCCLCQHPIVDKLIKARGRSYHACCFKCNTCDESLDGSAFMMDLAGNLFCVSDFNKQHGMRCRGCKGLIAAEAGKMEVSYINYLDDHFHMHCFKCQDCQIKLSSSCKGNGCFSMNTAILCGKCHVVRLQKMATTGSTEL